MDAVIPRLIGKYVIGTEIGKGTFSRVMLACTKESKDMMCVKIINKSKVILQKEHIQLQREVNILLSIYHPNVVRLYEVIEDDDNYYFIMEYCQGQSLLDLINKTKGLDDTTCRVIFRQLIWVLDYLHTKGIFHRDIKPDNIIVDAKLGIKLIDFGFSTITLPNTLLQTFCGSLQYVSPECLLKKAYYGSSSDVWSAGVVLYTMATGKYPWKEGTNAGIMNSIINCNYRIPHKVCKTCASVIKSILVAEPSYRPSAKDLLSSVYLQGLPVLPNLAEPVKKESRFLSQSFKQAGPIKKWKSDQQSHTQKVMSSHIPLQYCTFTDSSSSCVSDSLNTAPQPDLDALLDSLPGKKRRRSTFVLLTSPEEESESKISPIC